MRWWKIAGLAGLTGVAATGIVLARAERQRRAYTPEQIRERLHERVAAAPEPSGFSAPPGETDAGDGPAPATGKS